MDHITIGWMLEGKGYLGASIPCTAEDKQTWECLCEAYSESGKDAAMRGLLHASRMGTVHEFLESQWDEYLAFAEADDKLPYCGYCGYCG